MYLCINDDLSYVVVLLNLTSGSFVMSNEMNQKTVCNLKLLCVYIQWQCVRFYCRTENVRNCQLNRQ